MQVHYGLGRHKSDLSAHQFREFEKYSYGEWIQTFATLMFTKVSICLFLLRIPISKVFIRSLRSLIAVLVLSNVILTILWIFQCRPLEEAWDKTVQGSCFSTGMLQRIIISQASMLITLIFLDTWTDVSKVISIASDFILAAFPILILRKVQIKPRLKVGLCVLMGLGVMLVYQESRRH